MDAGAILFDADGVIVRSEMFSLQYQKEYGISDDDMLPFFRGEFQKAIVGKADLIEIVRPWLKRWRWDGTPAEFLRYWFESENKIDERLVEAIGQLRKKGIICCLATNQEKHRKQYMKDHMGFSDIFDAMFLSCDIGYKKPERQFYQHVLDKLKDDFNIGRDEIIFFDDSEDNIRKAEEVGIVSHLYNRFEDFLDIAKHIKKEK